MENDTLPEGFDGVFRFTNFTTADFNAKWGGVEYTFPAMKTVPLIIPNASPYEIQNIRKKFAKELATAVFYQSDKFKDMDLTVEQSQAGQTPALYTDKDLEPFIQKCLEPLESAQAKMKVTPKRELEGRVDENGEPVSKVLNGKETLINGAVVA